MGQSLRILAFAYVYPPDAGSGAYRTLHFANHWAESGDAVAVVTAKEEDFHPDALIDAQLSRRIHSSIRVIRAAVARPHEKLLAWRARLRNGGTATSVARPATQATSASASASAASKGTLQRVKDWISALLQFPDAHSGWIFDAVRRGLHQTRQEKIDCIYASGGPWSGMVAAMLVHKIRRIPLVIDFRDPWASNPNLLELPKSLLTAHRWAEAVCVRNAARVITNTDELRQDFVRRYPRLDPQRFVAITNGFEEMEATIAQRGDKFRLVHAGALYASRNPANFLLALQRLVTSGAVAREHLRVQFIGGLEAQPATRALLDGLGDVVEILPRVPHAEALALQRQASALLLFQTGFPLQVPRKLFEYFAIGLPILAIADTDGATARVLQEVESKFTVHDDAAAIEAAVLSLYQHWQNGGSDAINRDKINNYSNRSLATRLRNEMAACAGLG